MGKLMLNGINYTGGGGGGGGTGDLTAVELTKAQYDALTPAQKEDTTKLYMVTDYGSSGLKPAEFVDIFNGASTITATQTAGVTLLNSSIINNIGEVDGSEWSAGYEGFNIALTNLVIGDNYILNFDFKFRSADWFSGGQYRTGYALFVTDKHDYNNYTDWAENLPRDTASHGHRQQFTATATTMYLSFNLCGCADYLTNFWSISNFYVEKIGSGKHYTTTEELVGTWIDGSAVYQKTYQYNSVVGGGSYTILDTSIKQNTTAFIELVQLSMRIQPEIATNLYANTIGGLHAEVAANNDGLYFENTTGYDVYSFTVTVRYTKSS